jgi:branched-chain amino acid transport system substrate-binding protein
MAGSAADGVVVVSHYSNHDTNPEMAGFVKRYSVRFNAEDQNAASGYDAMSILAQAIEKSRSFNPIVVSATLKAHKQWRGLAGLYDFAHYGDVVGHKLYIEEVKNGKFAPVDD